MGLFQQTILKKQMLAGSEKIRKAYELYAAYFLNPEIQENIRNSKEEQFQEGFLRELFVKILGYTLNPDPNYNLITEKKNEADSKKADGAILVNGEVKAVIELKDHKTTDLKQVETQAFGYKNNNRKASCVIISNFEKLRFYIENTIDFEEFNLFGLTEDDFAVLWICLAYENIADDLPKRLKSESTNGEDQITKNLYQDYSSFKQALFENIQKNNPSFDKLELFRKTQKLLDRFLFVFFAEDKGLLPPNSMKRIIDQWDKRNEDPLNEYQSLYARFKLYFKYMNEGHKGKAEDIFGYNGGLFKPDEILETIEIDDDILKENVLKLAVYDFDTEVDVNILGHIFEHSLSEIEEITNQLSSPRPSDTPLHFGEGKGERSKRKKDGIFYTPRYITTYIVENTLGKLCTDKKAELVLNESEYVTDKKRPKAQTKLLSDKLTAYREWLLSLTICDPACGSGAFLNAALDFLMAEHRLIDELEAKLSGNAIVFPNIENAILENNLYGVDINEESVEIAKLALWLRTAKPQRKLNSLNNNIKCGNSLISPTTVTRGFIPLLNTEKSFDWHKEFPQVFTEKVKIAYHVTTAIHDSRTSQRMIDYNVREKRFNGTLPEPQVYPLDEEDELIITETILEIVKEDGLNVLSYNICHDHLHILLVCEAEELDKIVGKIKGKTARAFNLRKGINPLVKEEGDRSIPLWTQKFGYKEITTSEQLYNTIEYIQNNRIKHELTINKGIHPLAEEMLCTIDHAFRPEYKGGFDVVIGNPPYVFAREKITDYEKEYYTKHYESAKYQVNTYILFIEKAFKLNKKNGLCGLIVPNSWLMVYSGEDLRRFMMKNITLNQIVSLLGKSFEDANVETVIMIAKNKSCEANHETVILKNNEITSTFSIQHTKRQMDFNENKGIEFNVFADDESASIIEKMKNGSKNLDEVCSVKAGLQAYEKGKGIPEQTAEDVKNRPYDFNFQYNQDTYKYLEGSDVLRYGIAWSGTWLWYGSHLAAPRTFDLFSDEKIIVREITGKYPRCIIAVYSNETYLYNRSNIAIVKREGYDISLKFVTVLLNSSLMSYYFVKNTAKAERKLFPKIILNDLRLFPIKEISLEQQQPFIYLADKMLSLNSDLQTKCQRFLKRLSDNFTKIKITEALERFDELEFKQFLAELAKQKIMLSLKQQDEWEEYFNEYQTECRNFVNQINATDKEIDRMVYGLYGLTEEEVGIIETNNN